ncbi:aldo/keto reductase [Bacteroidota bacterium]
MNRREFLINTTAAGMIAISPFPLKNLAGTQKKYISDKILLGNTGIEASRLAIGTGSNGWAGKSNQTRQLGIKGLAYLFERALDIGVNFWDLADQYGTHPHAKEGLKRVNREKVVILTKTHATTEQEMKDDLDRFRKELGTDYIDIILLHLMMDEDWNEKKKAAMNVLSQARENGIIKAHGVSCHSLKALKTAASSDWVQVDLARINPAGVVMDATVPVVTEVLRDMKAKGKGIIGMKVFGAGKLVNRIDESLHYVLSQPHVDSFTIGIENFSQLKDLEKRVPEASVMI